MPREHGFDSIDHELSVGRKWCPKVRASDLLAALTDPAEMVRQDPTAPMPRLVLERLRIVGEDRLTAADNALYRLLIALARQNGFEARTHSMEAGVAHTYLGVTRWTDLKRSIQRLSETRVAFAIRNELFREAGEVAMVNVHHREGVGANRGRNEICWEFPSILETVFRHARMYAYEELAAFPKFTSKYAGRLYGLAASHASRGGWTTTPEKLADALGWDAAAFHWGSFVQRCLDPALKDIEKHVTRIAVDHELSRSEGRGKKVSSIRFHVRPLGDRRLDETRTMILKREAYDSIVAADVVHPPHMLPSPTLLGRACSLVRPQRRGARKWTLDEQRRAITPEGANVAWRTALDEARLGVAPAPGRVPGMPNLFGERLLRAIEDDGLEKAFIRWLQGESMSPYHRTGYRTTTTRDLKISDGLASGELRVLERTTPQHQHIAVVGSAWAAEPDEEDAVPEWDYLEKEVLPEDVNFSAAEDVDDGDIPF